ncbi:lysoplasmalogenase [Ruminococcaceae bacterium OttesenSCG-928-A16]|nr:lysoplasmalogenase [Ruminococcaceae bacterium OttesenSCG-928-A16]
MNLIILLVSVLYLIGLGVLLWVTRYKRRAYARAKGALSCLFVVASLLAFWLGSPVVFSGFWLLLVALVLCMAGDILLGLANRTKVPRAKPFAGGAASFLLAHVFFCLLLYQGAPLHPVDFILPALLVLALFLLGKADAVRLKKMWLMGYVYTFTVGLMACKAVQVAIKVWPALPFASALLALGAILFLISDIILLFLYFGTIRHKWMRYANLSTYYVGIYLIALTAYWM